MNIAKLAREVKCRRLYTWLRECKKLTDIHDLTKVERDYKKECGYLIEKIKQLKLGNLFSITVNKDHEISSISFNQEIFATGIIKC